MLEGEGGMWCVCWQSSHTSSCSWKADSMYITSQLSSHESIPANLQVLSSQRVQSPECGGPSAVCTSLPCRRDGSCTPLAAHCTGSPVTFSPHQKTSPKGKQPNLSRTQNMHECTHASIHTSHTHHTHTHCPSSPFSIPYSWSTSPSSVSWVKRGVRRSTERSTSTTEESWGTESPGMRPSGYSCSLIWSTISATRYAGGGDNSTAMRVDQSTTLKPL